MRMLKKVVAVIFLMGLVPSLFAQSRDGLNTDEKSLLKPYIQFSRNTIITAVAVSPDGQIVAGGTRDVITNHGEIILRNAKNGLEFRSLNADGNLPGIRRMVFSPNGTYLAVACSDGSVFMWETKTWTLLSNQKIFDYIFDIAFSPDEKYLAVCNSHVVILDVNNFKECIYFEKYARVYAFAWKDTQTLLWGTSSSRNEVATVKSLNLNSNTVTDLNITHKSDVRYLAIKNDDELLTATKDGIITCFNIDKKNAVYTVEFDSGINSLCLSPDKTKFVTSSSESKSIRLFDANTGYEDESITDTYAFYSAVFSFDGNKVFSGYFWRTTSLFSWNLIDNDIRLLAGRMFGAEALSINKKNGFILCGSNGGNVAYWNTNFCRPDCSAWIHDNSVFEAAFSDDGTKAWTVSLDGTIREYDGLTGQTSADPVSFEPDRLKVVSASVDVHRKRLLIGTNNGYAYSVDLKTGKIIDSLFVGENIVCGISVLKNDRYLLTACRQPQQDDYYTESNQDDNHHTCIKGLETATEVALIDSASFKIISSEIIPPKDNSAESAFFFTAGGELLDGRYYVGTSNGGIFILKDYDKVLIDTEIQIPNDMITSVVQLNNGAMYVSGQQGYVYKINNTSDKVETVYDYHTQGVARLVAGNDGTTLVSTSNDGAVRIFDPLTNHWIGMAVSFDSSQWIVFTDDGYWDGSLGCHSLLCMTDGYNAYSVEQFAVQMNRPDIILARMKNTDSELIKHYATQYEKRLKESSISDDEVKLDINDIPLSTIVSTNQDGKNCTVICDFSTSKSSLKYWNVWVNGVPFFGKQGNKISGKKKTVSVPIPLTSGRNKIEISCVNDSGSESIRDTASVYYNEVTRGTLYFLGFGVSNYKDSQLNLKWAAADAQDMASLFAAYKDNYDKVIVQTWTDNKVDKNALNEAEQIIAKALPEDTVILFVAGHGVRSAQDEQYYYLGYDTNVSSIEKTAIPFEKIEELFFKTDARSKLFFMDTCESGTDNDFIITEETKEVRTSVVSSSRGFSVVQKKEIPASVRQSLYQKDRWIYNSLLRRSGAVVFSSCRGNELSYEFDDLKNGAFTAGVKLFFNSVASDAESPDSVTISDLRADIPEIVAGLVKDRVGKDVQHPIIDRDNLDAVIHIYVKK